MNTIIKVLVYFLDLFGIIHFRIPALVWMSFMIFIIFVCAFAASTLGG